MATYNATYDPYGSLIQSFGASNARLGYAGEYTDPSGLVYLRARYMNPALGVFLSKDPFAGWTQRVMSRNGYTYAEGNPVNFTDPSGEFIFGPWGALIGGVAGAAIGGLLSWGFAEGIYLRAERGDCGCPLKEKVREMGKAAFIRRAVIEGVWMGATFGAAAGADPIGLILGGGIGVLMGGIGLIEALNDRDKNGANICNTAQAIISGASIALSALGMRQGLRESQSYSSRGARTTSGSGGNSETPITTSQSLTIPERLQIYFQRLRESPPARSANEAIDLVNAILDQVEDEYSGVPKNPNPGLTTPDGRMYPVQPDRIDPNPNVVGGYILTTRGNLIYIGPDGSIQIYTRVRTPSSGSLPGDLLLDKTGGG